MLPTTMSCVPVMGVNWALPSVAMSSDGTVATTISGGGPGSSGISAVAIISRSSVSGGEIRSDT